MTIKRVRLVGLLTGVEGFVPPSGMEGVLSGLFEYQGFDYYVRPSGRYGIWDVFKTASDGRALAEYVVRRERKTLTCDCHSGRNHLACRHKEMVEMFVSNRESGVCGTQPAPKREAPKPKRVSILAPERKQDLAALMRSVDALLEKANAGR